MFPSSVGAQAISMIGLEAGSESRPALAESSASQVAQGTAHPEGLAANLRRVAILVALYAIPLTLAVQPVTDPDLWWHLRTGQWILANGTVPTTDPFSSYGAGKPWVAYSWLFEVAAIATYVQLGLFGILLLRVILCLAVAVAVHRFVVQREPRFVVATALTAAVFIVLCPLLSERPWLFTILFSTFTLDVILDLRQGIKRWTAWLLPLCFALWANLHIQFVYGLFLLALACAAPVIDRLAFRGGVIGSAKPVDWRRWGTMVALATLCAAATLLTPYHARLYGVVLEYATQTGAYNLVSELRPLEFRSFWSWCVLALAGTSLFVLARRPAISSFDFLLLATAVVFAFRSQRDAWFLALAALAVLANGPAVTVPESARFALTSRRIGLVAVGIVLVAAFLYWKRDLRPAHLEEAVTARYPVQAASFVEAQGYQGPLYNDFDWGGYLIWRLPRLPVGMDGRTNLHGDERLARHALTRSGARGWDSDPELTAARVVIVPMSLPLAELLRRDPRFELAYEDEHAVAVVFVARRSE
jgi:hypothetical protein